MSLIFVCSETGILIIIVSFLPMFKPKINFFLILHFISIVMVFESLFMLAAVAVSIIYKEENTFNLLLAFAFTFGLGVLVNITTRRGKNIEPPRKESIMIVSVGWVILGLFGTLPYLLTNSIPDFYNAFFESISGFTTTGSSILSDIEALPKSVLFWRAETHWIGGMGIIVLVIAIMPFLQISGKNLFYSETSNVAGEKISIRIRYVARNLWLVYVGLTFIESIFLIIGKMPVFDSICHSFATIATGGFSTKNDSIAGYSPYIQYVITVFMLLSGINFTLHVLSLKGKIKTALKNEELRMYLSIILVTGAALTAVLFFKEEYGFEKAFRESFFQVTSIITATGFVSADYLTWPFQAIFIIGMLMLVGASAGSTGGGVKVIRHLISLKKIGQTMRNTYSPRAVAPIRYNGKVVGSEYVAGTMAFIIMYYSIVIFGIFVMMAFGQDVATSFGAVATSMAGIGPGFGTVGPVSNFLHLPVFLKYFMTLLMVIGRLEIYAVLVLFTRWFWNR